MTEKPLSSLTALEAAEQIANGDMSAEGYIGACLDRIAEIDGEVQAFVHLDPADALSQARVLDERRRNGFTIGPLHGLPVAIKDIFDTADYRTEYGSDVLKGHQPMSDSTVVARLREAGAVIIGKTVTTEFAYFTPGATRNPHDLSRTPGGSSSGSAAAVAAGMVPLAIGSQTNGSTIRPASFCGVYGCKPSHGLISRHGALVLSPTLDHVGVFARSLADTALVLEVLAGYDPRDPDTRMVAAPGFLDLVASEPPMPPRFAFLRTPVWEQAEPSTRAAFEDLVESLGEYAVAVDLPDAYAAAWDDQRDIMAAEMAHHLNPALVRGGDRLSPALRDLLAAGRAVSAVRHQQARENARGYAIGIGKLFDEYDAIITPATPGIAPVGTATGNPAFCSLWSLTGLPALSLPLLGGEGGLPLGVQLVGDARDDGRLLRSANWLVDYLSE